MSKPETIGRGKMQERRERERDCAKSTSFEKRNQIETRWNKQEKTQTIVVCLGVWWYPMKRNTLRAWTTNSFPSEFWQQKAMDPQDSSHRVGIFGDSCHLGPVYVLRDLRGDWCCRPGPLGHSNKAPWVYTRVLSVLSPLAVGILHMDMMDIQRHSDFTVQQVGTKAKRRTKTMMRTRSTQTGKMNLFETEHDRDWPRCQFMFIRDDPTGSTGGSVNLDREEIPLPDVSWFDPHTHTFLTHIYIYIYIYIRYMMICVLHE